MKNLNSYVRLAMGASILGAGACAVAAFAGCSAATDAGPGSPSASSGAVQPRGEIRSFVDRVGETEYYVVGADEPPAGHPRNFVHPRTDANGVKLLGSTTPPAGAWGGNDLQSAYGISTAYSGSGPTVAIIDGEDDPNAEADLAVYRAQYGIPACTTANGCFRKISETGATTPLPPTASTNGKNDGNQAEETALDIEMVSVTCPSCKIVLVENANYPPFAAWNAAIAAGAAFVSNSFGYFETNFASDAGASYADVRGYESTFNHPGISFFAGSGDSGFDRYIDGSVGTYWPATSAYVTAVGGTVLSESSTAPFWSQTAWPSSGAGCSSAIAKPAWQTDTWCGSYRTIADVSAVAQGIAVYDSWSSGGWTSANGTSFATPLTAGMYAKNGWVGDGPSFSYGSPSSFTNVTTGNDCTGPGEQCSAGTGYNEPTGNGAPHGNATDQFYVTPTTVTVSQNSIGYGTLYWGGSWVSGDQGADNTFTIDSALPWTSAGAPIGVTYLTPTGATLQIDASLYAVAGSSYPVTVTATDKASGESHAVNLTVKISPCAPIECPANACGTISATNGCGGTTPVTCGSCATGMVCSENVCCQKGQQWDPVIATCICEAGTTWSSVKNECVAGCNTPACQCRAAGGEWDGKTCE